MMANVNSSKLLLPQSVQVWSGVDLGGTHELPMIGTTEFCNTRNHTMLKAPLINISKDVSLVALPAGCNM